MIYYNDNSFLNNVDGEFYEKNKFNDKLSAVLIFFLILACSTASADSLSITSPSPDANFQLDANQNPPDVEFEAFLITGCPAYGTVFNWTGVLNYNYLDENGETQNKIINFKEDTVGEPAGEGTQAQHGLLSYMLLK